MAHCKISWDIRQHLIESSLEIYRRDYGTKNENTKQFEKAEETLLEAIRNGYELTRWIPVTERLPEKNGEYLITGRQGAVNKRLYYDGRWYGNWSVLAWMPLPEPYEEGGTK